MGGHSGRVGALAWNGAMLSTGGHDRIIAQRDVRLRDQYTSLLRGHSQQVCGLRWSYDENQLASGGNDDKVYIWSLRSSKPLLRFTRHTAAVRALAWSPHQR